MDTDDLEPRKALEKPKDLDLMGVAELEDYLAELEAEAERVKQKIASKSDYKSAADAFFKS
ncbi:DUF1192 domain-containing protein [Rhodovibrionaceae bacterium A322]